MALQTVETKGRKGAVIITLIVVVLIAAGVMYYIQMNNNKNGYDSQKISSSFTGLEDQDKQFAATKVLHLQPASDVEEHYVVLRPLEQHSAETQEATKQTTENGQLKAVETYALAKNDDAGETQYNASFFVYRLEGEVTAQSTAEIIKSQLDAVRSQAKMANQNVSVTVSEAQKITDITLRTTTETTVRLASAKFEQTIRGESGNQKKLAYVVAAAKFGNQLLVVSATFADENEFAAAREDVQRMADQITLQFSE